MPQTKPSITELLAQWSQGNNSARDTLVPLVYRELHNIAEGYLRREQPGHTLQPTALINEAFLRLLSPNNPTWQDRKHFFRAAAAIMRHVLVDYARMKQAEKRPPAHDRISLQVAVKAGRQSEVVDLLILEDALTRLARQDSRPVEIVELRYFAGFTVEETAEALGLSPATVKREWNFARAWLHHELLQS